MMPLLLKLGAMGRSRSEPSCLSDIYKLTVEKAPKEYCSARTLSDIKGVCSGYKTYIQIEALKIYYHKQKSLQKNHAGQR
jgi:hypothetical protein